MKKEVEKKESNLPALSNLFEKDAGGGFENVTAKDFRIPIVRVIQSGSPQLKPANEKYIKEAKPGMLRNIATNEIFESIRVIPVSYFRRFVEYLPDNGGFVGEHLLDSEYVKKAKKIERKLWTESGTELVETGYYPCLHVKASGALEQIVLVVSSSFWEFSKEFLECINSHKFRRKDKSFFIAPFWSHIYTITTRPKKNNKGEWDMFTIADFEVITNVELYTSAKEMSEQLKLNNELVSSEELATDDIEVEQDQKQTKEVFEEPPIPNDEAVPF